MPMSESSKCQDSNIPLRKKSQRGCEFVKIPKGYNKFPELHKYIETIVKGDVDSDSSADGCSSGSKVGRKNFAGKGSESRNKQETLKKVFSVANYQKVKNKTPKKGLDSRDKETLEKTRSGSRASQNNDGQKVDYSNAGQLLKNFYPNPYDLEKMTELKKPKSSQKRYEWNAKDGRFYPVDNSKPNPTEKEIISQTKKNNRSILQENKTKKTSSELKNCVLSMLLKNKCEDTISKRLLDSLVTNKTWDFVKNENKKVASSNSSCSWESEKRAPKCVTPKNKIKTEKNVVFGKIKTSIKKSRESHVERSKDYDFQKITLLTSNYFCDAIRKNSEMQRKKKTPAKSSICLIENLARLNNIKNTQVSSNLAEHKVTADTLLSTNEKDLKNATCNNENQKLVQFLNKVNISKTLAQREEDERYFGSSLKRTESYVVIEEVANERPSGSRLPSRKGSLEMKISGHVDKKTKGKTKSETRDTKTDEDFLESDEFWNGLEKRNAAVDYDKLFETSKKIDDVLQFMYNCLQKFKNENKSTIHRTEITESLVLRKEKPEFLATVSNPPTNSTSLIKRKSIETVVSVPEKICHIQSAPIVQDRHMPSTSKLSPELGETSRQGPKPQSRRIQSSLECNSRNLNGTDKNGYHSVPTQRDTICGDPEPPNTTLLCESVEVSPEPEVQTVEVQNELGGYTEETVAEDDPKLTKAILPHSVKFRNRNNEACEVIKNALETEEKLMAGGSNTKEPSDGKVKKPGISLNLLSAEEILVTSYNGQMGAYSLIGGVDQEGPCFVIYVNSLPKTLIPSVSSLSISLNESKTLDLRHYQITKSSLMKFSVANGSTQQVSSYYYVFKEELLKLLNKTIVVHTSRVACLLFINEIAKLEVEVYSKNSKRLKDVSETSMNVLYKEPVPCSMFGVNYSFEERETNMKSEVLKLRFFPKYRGESEENVEETRMQALEEAIEETEEKVLLLQETKGIVGEKKLSGGTVKENSGPSAKKKKVHDLLLRTYSLQNKLHRYLHKMTCLQASSTSCPLIHHETFLDLGVLFHEKTSTEVFPLEEVDVQTRNSHPMVYWPSEPLIRNETKLEKVVEIISRPPFEEKPTETKDSSGEEKETPSEEDDQSVVCSRKTSSNLSNNQTKDDDEKPSQDLKLLNNIFNELELSRKSHDKEKKPVELSFKNEICEFEDRNENKTSEQEFDAKAPAKVLKTLFRGKESLTELSMGLKDFPMTEVSNISVEKKKLSANHTKISICISKGKTEEMKKFPAQETGFQINSGVRNKFSFFDLDSFRPTMSTTCRSDYSKLENDTVKSGSEEEEEDFKSVSSSLADSDLETEEEEKPELKKTEVKTAPQRKLPRKITSELGKTTKTAVTPKAICRYKELEPLQQALTEMQIRMRRINRDSVSTNEYYRRALKLAKMSAGYCQNCGNHSVIPDDTFGFYRNLLPTNYCTQSRDCFFRNTPNSSFYSFRARSGDVSDHLLDINVKQSSYNMRNGSNRSARTIVKSSLHDGKISWSRT